MPKYNITIRDHSNPRDTLMPTYTGTFIAESPEEATKQAEDFYALELDTFADSIEIVDIITT